MKKLLSFVPIFLVATLGMAQAQVLLIGPGVRNGGFDEDTSVDDVRKFDVTPVWINTAGVQTANATRTNVTLTGAVGPRNLLLTRTLTVVAGQDTAHTIATGDTFSTYYWWRDASNWADNADFVRIRLFTTDDDLITGVRTVLATTDSPLSTTNSTYEEVDQPNFYTALPTDVGKNLFLEIDTAGGDNMGFARLDDFELSVGPPPSDPTFNISGGDFVFGALNHPTGVDSSARTMTFTNAGPTQSLTVDAVTWNNDAGGIFSVTSTTPSLPAILAVGETLEVEVTATGGGGYTNYVGELLIDTTPDDQDTTVPVTATISTNGDPVNFLFLNNPNMDLFTPGDPMINDDGGIQFWNGFSVPTGGLKSTNGARLKGTGDPSLDPSTNLWDNLSQTFKGDIFPDFQATVCFAIPDFDAWTGLAPSAADLDRSFHLVILGTTTLTQGGDYDDVQTADAIIDLFYLADGITGDTGPGFFLYDGASFVRQAGLGTILESTAYTAGGEPIPGAGLNVYQLTITGDDFGTAGASYDIEISGANTTTVAGSVTGVTTFHGLDPKTTTAKAIVFTTADVSTATGDIDLNSPVIQQPSFWVDQVVVGVPANLPIASWDLTDAPKVVKTLGDEILTTSFTVTNTGIGTDLTVDSPVFGDSKFSITSPSFPVNIPVGASQVFDVQIDLSGETTEQNFLTTLTLTTNDFIQPTQVVDLEGQVLPTGTRLLVDYDDGLANGIHESSIRNGGFEDGVALQTFLEMPIWTTAFAPEGNGITGTLDTDPATGLLHSQASGFSGGGSRAQPTQIFTPSDWSLQEGDSLQIEYKAKAGDAFDMLASQYIVEIIDADGNLVNDPINSHPSNDSRLTVKSTAFADPAAAAYESFSFSTPEIQPGSPWIGNSFRVRFLKGGLRTGFVNIDDISITANMAVPVTLDLEVTAIAFDPVTKDVTIRFVDSGAASYSIESDADLLFPAGTTTYPLDGSEDTVTYPGEIEFIFNDPTATGTFHGWRVVAP